jgi:hypothetical protein
MMRTRLSVPVGFLLLVLGLGLLLPLPEATADDKCNSEIKTSITPLVAGIEGKATLCINAKGVSGKMKTKHLNPGDAYTIWFIYFDQPSLCVGGGPGICGDADFGGDNPLGVFGRFDSAVAPDNGKVDFAGSVRGLQLSSGSQVWLIMFGHGAADTNDGRQLARQLLTPEDPAAGAPHLGNIVDGPRFTPAAIAIFDIP